MRIINLIVTVLMFSFLYSCNNEENSNDIGIKKKDASEKTDSENKSKNKSDSESDSENKNAVDNSGLQTITSNEVKLHIGDSLNIKGIPADIYLTDKVAYLNFENKFPKHIFSCVIFENKFLEFGDLSRFKNKNVIVTGKVTTYKNKPQVVLNSKDQIKIIY